MDRKKKFQTSPAARPNTRAPADDQFWHLCKVENYVICIKIGINSVHKSAIGSRSKIGFVASALLRR